MLKRFFMVMALTLAFTMPSQAVSIQELKSSLQFKVVNEVTPDVPNANERTTWYLDTSSIEVLEYAPPMYKIKATVYNAYQSTRKNTISSNAWIVSYDTRQSLPIQVKASTRAILRTAPNTTRYDIADTLFYEAYRMHFEDVVVK